ncbi:MAG: hypothetical protein IAF38_10335 [Bacteroidia bacterium]|nr:hypothetical protein [Bacteroidia bacterium]
MKVIAFRRDPTLGIIYIIMSSGAGGMLIFDLAFAQSPLTIFTAVLLLAFAGSSTWLFKTPFAHISAGKVNINYSITERKNFLIANLKQAKRISKKKNRTHFYKRKQ